jgi:hypothetical protein
VVGVDGFEVLGEAFASLSDSARCTVGIRFDPRGDNRAVPPLTLRRDSGLEEQVLGYLMRPEVEASSGDYQLQLRESGRVLKTATVTLHIPQGMKHGGPQTPAKTPAATPAETPAATQETASRNAGGDFTREIGERVFREAVESYLSPPEDADEEPPEEPEEPPRSGFLVLVEKVVESPVLAGPLGRLVEAAAELVQERTRMATARAGLYNARAIRFSSSSTSSSPPAPAGTPRQVQRVDGVRLVTPPRKAEGAGRGNAG